MNAYTDRYKIKPMLFLHSILGLIVSIALINYLEILSKVNLSLVWYLIYLSSLFVIVKEIKNSYFFNPIVLLPGAYLILIVLGSIVFDFLRGRQYNYFLSNIVGIGYLALLTGLLLSVKFRYKLFRNSRKIYTLNSHPIKSRYLIFFLVIFSLIATLLLFLRLGTLPILAKDIQEARLQLTTGAGYLNIFFIGLRIISFLLLYEACSIQDKRRLIFSHLLAVVIGLLLVSIGSRGSVIIYVLTYFSIYIFFNRGKFSIKKFIVLCLIITIFIGVLGSFRKGNIDIVDVLTELALVITIRPAMLEHIVHIYNTPSTYYWGMRYLSDLQRILPGTQESENVELKGMVSANTSTPELAGFTPSIVGEAYMNFGAKGIPFVLLFIGFIAGKAYKSFLTRPTFVRFLFYLTLIYGLMSAVNSGIGEKLPQFLYQWFWVFFLSILYKKVVKFI